MLYVNVLTMPVVFGPVLEVDTGIFQLHIYSVIDTNFKKMTQYRLSQLTHVQEFQFLHTFLLICITAFFSLEAYIDIE